MVSVAVDGDRDDVVVDAQPGVIVQGTVRFEGAPGILGTPQVQFTSTDGFGGRTRSSDAAVLEETGRFRIASLLPGRYLVRAGRGPDVPPEWHFDKVTIGGRDVTDEPIEFNATSADDVVVTFTRRATDLRGVVHGVDGTPDVEATVVVFPTNPQAWQRPETWLRNLKTVMVSHRGAYALANLPPGEYFAAALSDADGARIDAELLRRLAPIATRVRLDYDTPVALNLRRVSPQD